MAADLHGYHKPLFFTENYGEVRSVLDSIRCIDER